jgi:hypothetical protein
MSSALRAEALARYGLSAFAALIDVQPDVAYGERSLLVSQCAGCSLVDFLRGQEALERFPVLDAIRKFFSRLPEIEHAHGARDARLLRRAASRAGARGVITIDAGMEPPIDGLPVMRLARGDAPLAGAAWVMVSPDAQGTGPVLDGIRRALRAGVTQIALGYPSHASAMDHWSDFAGAPDFPEAWRDLVQTAWTLGVSELVMLMPYPPCALLQWPQHRPLEALRARLDLQLRRFDAEASLMCPENVSGYVLFNDTQTTRASTVVVRDAYAIRYENLVMPL